MPPDPPNRPAVETVTIACLHCGKLQEVPRKAQTVTCKHCYKRLELQDVVIPKYEARRAIETLGIVTIEKKGQVIADRIHCGGLIVRGKVKAEITSRGPILVGPEADVIGNVTAPTMAIGAGAVLNGHYEVGRVRATTPPEPTSPEPTSPDPGPQEPTPDEGPIDPEA
ncbi:polymer-forming cytoskeletal protein [Humisphaera borealis]|uniref:Polymer-forming cytoskeletal protein n=1 Tax=Humisphaera borealis TaxID=2807512 RepID=A0A7M2WYG9_9BACT|nr:polymer-forming cytoskeletal protein [Humisphaera borealis]QOV90515.1 polymer-forming cytoskeletal protein [Humisphaera borealis]